MSGGRIDPSEGRPSCNMADMLYFCRKARPGGLHSVKTTTILDILFFGIYIYIYMYIYIDIYIYICNKKKVDPD